MSPPGRSSRLLLIIAYIGFISLGLPDTLLGVAWPSVRGTFGLEQSAIALIFIGAGSGYFLSSFFVGRLLGALGVGLLLAASSALVALSAFGYGLAPLWFLFAACAPLHGLGSGTIDAGLNHYVAHHFSVRHMNWLHACWSLGATLGPLIMTGAIAWLGAWRAGYLIVAAILASLALLFTVTRKEWDRPGEGEGEVTVGERTATVGVLETLRHPLVRLQVALYFVYAGLEATTGQWSFTLLTESRDVPRETAGLLVTLYWASIGAGRILLGAVADRVGIDRLLRFSTLTALAGAVLFAWNPFALASALSLPMIGFGLAAIYPSLMTRTPQRLGRGMSAHAAAPREGDVRARHRLPGERRHHRHRRPPQPRRLPRGALRPRDRRGRHRRDGAPRPAPARGTARSPPGLAQEARPSWMRKARSTACRSSPERVPTRRLKRRLLAVVS